MSGGAQHASVTARIAGVSFSADVFAAPDANIAGLVRVRVFQGVGREYSVQFHENDLERLIAVLIAGLHASRSRPRICTGCGE